MKKERVQQKKFQNDCEKKLKSLKDEAKSIEKHLSQINRITNFRSIQRNLSLTTWKIKELEAILRVRRAYLNLSSGSLLNS